MVDSGPIHALGFATASRRRGQKNRLVDIYAFKDTYLLRQMSEPQNAGQSPRLGGVRLDAFIRREVAFAIHGQQPLATLRSNIKNAN
jgi:hypothetical protein